MGIAPTFHMKLRLQFLGFRMLQQAQFQQIL